MATVIELGLRSGEQYFNETNGVATLGSVRDFDQKRDVEVNIVWCSEPSVLAECYPQGRNILPANNPGFLKLPESLIGRNWCHPTRKDLLDLHIWRSKLLRPVSSDGKDRYLGKLNPLNLPVWSASCDFSKAMN